jgi:predicted ArsR family transcriptional regulator
VRVLLPFVARESTLSAAANQLGMSMASAHYHVRRLLSFGLLQITRTEQRRGRPVKHYRSTHDAFFIPSELAKEGSCRCCLRNGQTQ